MKENEHSRVVMNQILPSLYVLLYVYFFPMNRKNTVAYQFPTFIHVCVACRSIFKMA